MFRKMRTFLLVLMIAALGNFLPNNGASQESISFSEKVAQLKEARAEYNSLGQNWEENKENLDILGSHYDTLDGQMAEGLVRLGPLKEEAENLMRDFERKTPEFDRRQATLEAREREQNRDVDAYNSQCGRTFDAETEGSAFAACNAWLARGNAVDAKVSQDIEQFEREVQALEDSINRAIEKHDNLLGELQEMEATQQSLLEQGLALQATSEAILRDGLRVEALIKELERSACRPGEYKTRTAEAFEECMRIIFDFGDGTNPRLKKWTPVDMSLSGNQSQFDLDSSVVKPDWEEDPDG